VDELVEVDAAVDEMGVVAVTVMTFSSQAALGVSASG
jgi:hypothetical protein